MKKLLLTGTFLLLGVFSVSAQEYQLPNLGFSNWKTQNGETTLTADNGSTQVRPGTEPEGWNASNINQVMDIKDLVTKVEENGNAHVKIYNHDAFGNIVPGYMTLATPWVFAYGRGIGMITYAKYGDGGSYGGVNFTYIPDAISLRYKKSGGTGETSHVIAYLWNGTFKSSVPNKVNTAGVYTYDRELEDVDRVVMGRQTDNISEKGTLIASVDKEISDDTDGWVEEEIPLTYKDGVEGKPEKMNVILSASDYWTRSNLKKGTTFEVDDVKFVYWSDLRSLSYDGNPIEFSDPNNIQITVFSPFDNSKVVATSGRGAFIDYDYDEAEKILKITITGEDNSESNPNKNEYEVKINEILPDASEVSGTYNRWIQVNVGDELSSESLNSVNIEGTEHSVTFKLAHFEYDGLSFDNITVPGAVLTYADEQKKVININAPQQMVYVGESLGEVPIKLDGTMTVDGKVLTADLDIPVLPGVLEVKVHVGDVPFTTKEENGILTVTGNINSASGAAYVKGESKANVIDLTGATLAKDLNSSNFSVEANNTLYKIADSQTLDGNNVIQNGTCKTLVLTDGLTFNAPEGFEADNVTFNRKFTTGNLSTVVLPFSFDATDVNGTVYKLESVENGVLSFKSVEGTADANVPYLVKTEGDNLFNNGTLTNATVAQTPETVENRIAGTGVTHVGNFGETMEITSDDQTSWYGYNTKGSFVKVLSGTVKPFRSAIESTGAAPSSFALKLDGTVTGILNLENPNAKVDVYTVSGVCVRKNVPAASALNGLSRGVYIVGGQKVVK